MTADAMWLLAINPTSGQGRGSSVGQEVSNFLANRKIEYKVVTGANALSLQENLRQQAPNSGGIIAVGGDGLLHMCIQIAVENSIPLATIPAGTGNDFVRTLGWNPEKPLEPLWAALNENSIKIDLGNVDGEYFGAIASTGFDSVVNERANRLKWPKGPAKYNVAMALELPKFKPINYRFIVDGKSYQREAMLIAAGNGKSYGGGMLVCPDADLTDGLLDLMILNPVSKREFVQIFPSVYKGKHIEHPQVEVIRAKEISIEADAICYADGERIGPMPAHITVAEKALSTWRR
jgi:diacylglycerol kinase (ATP)